MQITVNKEINYIGEANSLLYNYANSVSYEKLKSEDIKKISYSIDIYNMKYQRIINISNYVIDNLRVEKSKLDYYYKEIGNSQFSLSVYLLYTDNMYDSPEDYFIDAKSKSPEEIIRQFDYLLSQSYRLGSAVDEKPVDTFEDMMRIIDKSGLPAEDKWKIIQAYIDRDKHLEEIYKIIERTVLLLKECRSEINNLEEEFYKYWHAYTEKNDFAKEFQMQSNFTWDWKSIVIVPSVFNPHVIRLSVKYGEERTPDLVQIGIAQDSNFSSKPAEVDGEDLVNTLKLLSDKSKFEILRFIKDESKYGFEIANALNLSTSTISYHMNSLIIANLVRLEKDANKIYYSLNREELEVLLENTKKLLL